MKAIQDKLNKEKERQEKYQEFLFLITQINDNSTQIAKSLKLNYDVFLKYKNGVRYPKLSTLNKVLEKLKQK